VSEVSSNNINSYSKVGFEYAAQKKSSKFMIPVVLEPEMKDRRRWIGPVGIELANSAYLDYSADDHFDGIVEDLMAAINRISP